MGWEPICYKTSMVSVAGEEINLSNGFTKTDKRWLPSISHHWISQVDAINQQRIEEWGSNGSTLTKTTAFFCHTILLYQLTQLIKKEERRKGANGSTFTKTVIFFSHITAPHVFFQERGSIYSFRNGQKMGQDMTN